MNKKNNFFRERFLSLFDNLLWVVVLYALSILIPIVLKLEFQTILLIVILVSQIVTLTFLYLSRKQISNQIPKYNYFIREEKDNEIYLIDRFGLPHPIKDKNTELYLLEIFGYVPNDVPTVSVNILSPVGSEIIGMRRWSPPITQESRLSFEAQNALVTPKKDITRGDDDKAILSFDTRNKSEHVLQITSAKLIFDPDAPLTAADISYKNSPINEGLLTCTLLFNGESESKRLSFGDQARLDLILDRKLSQTESSRIIGARLGYIEVTGSFQGISISFHLPV